jgi:hypothetical protein
VSCTLAPAGSFVDEAGATEATLCPAGRFSATTGSWTCTLSPAGFYVPNAGATETIACPEGTTSGVGATECHPIGEVTIDDAIDAALADKPGLATSFHAKVDSIESAKNAKAKANKINAFVNAVEAQRGKALTDEEADLLIELAQAL